MYKVFFNGALCDWGYIGGLAVCERKRRAGFHKPGALEPSNLFFSVRNTDMVGEGKFLHYNLKQGAY